tara:strand:- start:432 stop:620 length:189 start_codon:yes stop_codon:yes gene_type:complete
MKKAIKEKNQSYWDFTRNWDIDKTIKWRQLTKHMTLEKKICFLKKFNWYYKTQYENLKKKGG